MGIDKYNAECRKIVMRYASDWERIVTRLGRWIGIVYLYYLYAIKNFILLNYYLLYFLIF